MFKVVGEMPIFCATSLCVIPLARMRPSRFK
nr:MAG TPA: hypothetical protein [Caudoviricetes sp.]